MSGPGMWMPKQKDGKNWELYFSLTVVATGEVITDRRKSFRVVADARNWVKIVKNLTVEANEVKEPRYSNFTYSKPSKI
jgi:hypothetical protein